jgi:hypothetical protein
MGLSASGAYGPVDDSYDWRFTFGGRSRLSIYRNVGWKRHYIWVHPNDYRLSIVRTALSASQVDSKQEGCDGAKLAHLLAGHGLFHDGHRAAEDCHSLP